MDFRPHRIDYNLKESESYQEIKQRLHHHLIDRIDVDRVNIGDMAEDELQNYVLDKVGQYVSEHRLAVTRYDMENLAQEMVDELTGYGPLEELIRDDRINDILVNGHQCIFVERAGVLQKTDLRFIDEDHVLRVVRRILAPLGRRIDESSPMVDARLPDGSRVNAIIPPLALDGPCVSIRKFRKDPLQAADLLTTQTFNDEMLAFLQRAVSQRANVLISGGTGSGKTTLLNVLSRYISPAERLVTIEDAAELQLGHDHVVRLETRPPNVDGRGEVNARDLMRNALRMRPDRVLLGEVRSDEVLDMLQAMNTGHDGCMSTVHANSPRDALLRLEMLAGFAGFQGQELTLKHMIATALDLIIQVTRLADGRRKVLSISEVLGVQDDRIVTTEIFHWRSDNQAFESTGLAPVNPKFKSELGGFKHVRAPW
jgi:pilus assembly protein CpaF